MPTTWIVTADPARARILQAERNAERLREVTELVPTEVGSYLDKARSEQRYDGVYLVAPSAFLGLLRRNLSRDVEKLVIGTIDEDLSWLTPGELEEHLQRHLDRRRRKA